MSVSIFIVAAIVGVVIIALLIPVFRKSNAVDLTSPTNEKPEYMRELPPAETMAKTLADGEGITIFDYEHGEKLAAPFAEQIEDIMRAKIQADPELAEMGYVIDFGADADHTLEIWVNDKKYKSISDLPDERLKQVMRESVRQWNK
jgi:hypothetical protein